MTPPGCKPIIQMPILDKSMGVGHGLLEQRRGHRHLAGTFILVSVLDCLREGDKKSFEKTGFAKMPCTSPYLTHGN